VVDGKESVVRVSQSNISLGDLIETVHASATDSLLKVLSRDLEHQLAKADEACTRDECVMAQGAATYIRELCGRLRARVLN
jgi:hypothetical protein